MRTTRLFSCSVFFLSLFVLPVMVQAVAVTDVLRVADEQIVSRGDFIRAAVKVLELPTQERSARLPYSRVPAALRPYIEAAHSRGALDVFGTDLQLARSITRGQALRVLTALQSLASSTQVEFTDVTPDTPDAQAVAVAVDRDWMQPQSARFFGMRRTLKGLDAVLLLRKVIGETGVLHVVPEQLNGVAPQTITVQVNARSLTQTSLPKSQILETVWQYVLDHYIRAEDIDPDEAAYRAAEGLVQSLGDPYTAFMRPARANNLETQISGQVSGIGAQVEERDGVVTIVTPLRGSPAEQAGLLPNDQILKVDGVSLENIGFLEAVEKIRGPKGSVVTLHIRRSGNTFDVRVQRDVVTVPEIAITWHDAIAVVEIMQFGRLTETQLRQELEDVQRQRPQGLILDLRNNPGGLLNAAELVVDNFVPLGTPIAQILSREGSRTDKTTFPPTIRADVPVVVLVNQGSASASEIVAGALQDAGRATVVGVPTFGKGTVQQVVRFNDDSGLKVTVAEWRTPNGRRIDEIGITPDVFVEYGSKRDEQMLKALEILR